MTERPYVLPLAERDDINGLNTLRKPVHLTRVVSVHATLETVTALCANLGIAISVIEPLQSGGTRVVLNNGADAEKVRRTMKAELITGLSTRSSLYVSRSGTTNS